MSRRTAICALLTLTLLTPTLPAAEIIGSYWVEAPTAASLIALGDGPATETWLSTGPLPVSWEQAYCGIGIVNDGYADLRDNCIVEVGFAASLLINGPGPELLMVEARFMPGSYALTADYTNFSAEYALPADAFSYTGTSFFYYRGSPTAGPYPAQVFVAPVDLTDLGVPLGASVSTVRFRTDVAGASPLGLGRIVPEPMAAAAALLGLTLLRQRHPRSTRR